MRRVDFSGLPIPICTRRIVLNDPRPFLDRLFKLPLLRVQASKFLAKADVIRRVRQRGGVKVQRILVFALSLIQVAQLLHHIVIFGVFAELISN